MNAVNSLMSQSEFAAHRGVGKSAVSNWKKAGLVVFAEGEGGLLLVDVQRTNAKLNAKLDPTRGRPALGAKQPGLEFDARPDRGDQLGDVRLELIKAQTTSKQLDNARRAGDLVPLAEAERKMAEMGRLARERMHSVARSLAERLAAVSEPRVIASLLGAEIDQAFGELADQVDGGALDDGEDAAETTLEADAGPDET
jgi:phage terminase Nu1 subunit (DNA packaging protein)